MSSVLRKYQEIIKIFGLDIFFQQKVCMHCRIVAPSNADNLFPICLPDIGAGFLNILFIKIILRNR